MSEKKYLMSLIDRFLSESSLSFRDKNIAYFKDVIYRIQEDESYVYEFIVGINEGLIDELISELQEDKKKSFKDKFLKLKSKIIVLKNDGKNLKFDDSEILIVNDFKDLMIKYSDDKNLSTYQYNNLKHKFKNNLCLEINDYDLITELIYKYENDPDIEYENAMDYLNRYNIVLIRKFSKPSKKDVTYVKVGESKSNVFNLVNDDVKNIIGENSTFNPFDNMVSFDFVPKERSRVNRKKKLCNDSKVDIGTVFDKYNYDYNSLPENIKNDLKNIDLDDLLKYFNFIKDNDLEDIIKNDTKVFCLLLLSVSYDDFIKNYKCLKDEVGLSLDSISELFKRYTLVFGNEGLDNFKNNYYLLKNCGIKGLNDFILNNISYFLNDYNDNLLKYNTLNELGINADGILKNAIEVYNIDIDLIKRNVLILDNYGFDLRDETDFKSFSVLGINNLSKVLDMFIEMGFSEFIHDDPTLTLRNIKSLIIKRILFAYRNGNLIWDNMGDNDNIRNNEYDAIIENKLVTLDGAGISLLISEHPILELLECGMRISSYNDSYFGNITRKTELVFNGKIISRVKAYSVFKVLVENNVNEVDALIYALAYNSVLDNSEYENLKNVVYRGNKVNSLC